MNVVKAVQCQATELVIHLSHIFPHYFNTFLDILQGYYIIDIMKTQCNE